MAEANYSHQSNLFDPALARPVTVIGAGSVGSHAVYALASMGVTDLMVWDGDTVMSDNTPSSLYGNADVGRPKVEALRDIVLRLTGVEIKIRAEMYTDQPLRNTSVVACVDTMAARRLIWDKAKMHPTIDILCDTRTREAYKEVLCIEPTKQEDIDRYEKLFFEDEFDLRQMCGRHSVIFVSMSAAIDVASNLANFWQNGRKNWRVAERRDTLQRVF